MQTDLLPHVPEIRSILVGKCPGHGDDDHGGFKAKVSDVRFFYLNGSRSFCQELFTSLFLTSK